MNSIQPSGSVSQIGQSDEATTFKEIQTDERYKKTERMLKLAILKKGTEAKARIPAWSSVSSIYGECSDSSYAALSLNNSRVGSEIVSSSSNMKKKLFKNVKIPIGPETITSSSPLQLPVEQQTVDDSTAMPPPRSSSLRFRSSQKTPVENSHTVINAEVPLSDHTPNTIMSNKYDDQVRKTNNFANSTYSKLCPDHNSIDETLKPTAVTSIKDARNRYTRVFSKWKVRLNEQGQLIIKGTLECGKVVRSKPVIRRLTSTSVESIFKQTYHLQGVIFDEKSELPDYIYGKFYNGFPDDWENVHQVWKSFIIQGSREDFRWPTPMTDDDDDIRSQITDYTIIGKPKKYPATRESNPFPTSKFNNADSRAPGFDESHSTCSKRSTKKNKLIVPSNHDLSSADEEFTDRSKVKVNQSQSDVMSHNRIEEKQSESTAKNQYSKPSTGSSKLKDIIQEDKLNVIIANLADKNCSREYIDKFMEAIDCLNYVVGNRPNESESEIATETPSPSTFKRNILVSNELSYSTETDKKLKKNENSKVHYRSKGTSKSNYYSAGASNYCEPTPLRKTTRVNKQYDQVNQLNEDERESSRYYRNCSTDSESEIDEESNIRHQTKILNSRKSVRVHKGLKTSVSEMHEGKQRLHTDRQACLPVQLPRIPPRQIPEVMAETVLNTTNPIPNLSLSPTRAKYEKLQGTTSAARKGKHKVYESEDSSVSMTEDEMITAYHSKHITQNDLSVTHRKPSTRTEHLNRHSQRNCRHNLRLDSSDSEIEISCKTKMSIPERIPYAIADEARALTTYSNVRTSNIHCQNDSLENTSTQTSFNKDKGLYKPSQDENISFSGERIVHSQKPMITNVEKIKTGVDASHHPNIVQSSHSNVSIIGNVQEKVFDSQVYEENIDIIQHNALGSHSKRLSYRRKTVHSSVDSNADNDNVKPLAKSVRNDVIDSQQEKNIDIIQNTTSDSHPKRLDRRRKMVNTSTDSNPDKENQIAKSRSKSVSPTKRLRSQSGTFGTKDNPKLLAAWTPFVVSNNSETCLAFKGNLLNELGHVDKRKHETDLICRRVSANLIETKNNVFYKLVGELNNVNHGVPKELVPMCRSGCPTRISEFCEKLQTFTGTKAVQVLCDTSVEKLSMPTSSRGRRILPPLNYWNGERVTLRDNQPVYRPSICQEISRGSSLDSSKCSINSCNTSADMMINSTEAHDAKTPKNGQKSTSSTRHMHMRSGRRIRKTLEFDSSEDEAYEKKLRTKKRKDRLSENSQDADERSVIRSKATDQIKKPRTTTDVSPRYISRATRSSQLNEKAAFHGTVHKGRIETRSTSSLAESVHPNLHTKSLPVSSTRQPSSTKRKDIPVTWAYYKYAQQDDNMLSDVPEMNF